MYTANAIIRLMQLADAQPPRWLDKEPNIIHLHVTSVMTDVVQMLRNSQIIRLSTSSLQAEEQLGGLRGLCAVYRGVDVSIEKSSKQEVNLTRKDLIEFVNVS